VEAGLQGRGRQVYSHEPRRDGAIRVAIVGGGCPFGLNLARHLLAKGYEVLGIGRSPAETTWPYKQFHISSELDAVVQELDTWRPEVIVNFAALGERAASLDPVSYHLFYQTNAVALARFQGRLQGKEYLRRFVQVSSGEVYGSVDKPATEETKLAPTSPYAVSKACFDQHLIAVHQQLGFPMNILRPCNLYCEGQQSYRVIPKAILCALQGKKLPLNGGGKSLKMYMHAQDLSDAIELVMDKAPIGEIYNVSPDYYDKLSFLHSRVGSISISEVVEMVAEVTGVRYGDLVEIKPPRLGADAKYLFSSRKLNALGWTPKIGMKEGLEGLTKWVSANRAKLATNDPHYRLRA
jgi:dTDP-glucose 4,6-dehydratase